MLMTARPSHPPSILSPAAAKRIGDFLSHHHKQLTSGIIRHSGLRLQDCEDVLSDTMLGLCSTQNNIVPTRSLFPLAYTIALRKARTKLKRLAAEASRTTPLPEEVQEGRLSGEDQIIADERRDAVRRFLNGLNPTDRRILEARHFDNQTWSGVAAAVRLPKTSVIRRYRHLVAKARHTLETWVS